MRINRTIRCICISMLIAATIRLTASQRKSFTLSSQGKATVDILIPDPPTPQDQTAAAELKKWLGQITGAEFSVIKKTGARPVISLGRTKLFKKECPKANQQNLGKEGYGIKYKDNNLFLYGGTIRGPLYAVMSLLEEDLGCRWYTPHCTKIPHNPDLVFTPRSRSYVPTFENREVYYFVAVNHEWALHNMVNPRWFKLPDKWGGSMTPPHNIYWNVHTLARLLPVKELFPKHPEYFPLLDGKRSQLPQAQPCLSNPEVLKIITKNALKALDEYPKATTISISENDSLLWCKCPKCIKELKEGYTRSDQIMRAVNYAAREILKKHPDITVSTIAYMDTYMPPEKVKPDPRIWVQLCTDKHAIRWPHLRINETKEFFTALKAWHATGTPITIWDYVVNFYDYLAPFANMQVVTDNLRLYKKYGVKGVMLQGQYAEPGGVDAEMKSWVWTKLLWDPSRNWHKLQQDFVKGYYGTAAKPIQQYYDFRYKTWKRWHDSPNRSGGLKFGPGFVAKAEKYLAKAEKLAANDPIILKRVMHTEVPIIYLKLVNACYSPKQLTPAEKTAYEKLFAKLEKIVKDNKMTKACEGGERVKLSEKLNGLKTMLLGKRPKVKADTMAIGEEFATTLFCKTKIVPDEKAGNGFAIKQPTNKTEWATQWRNPPIGRLEYGKKYGLRVRMRFTIKNRNGFAFSGGVYNPSQGEHVTRKFRTDELKDGYAWYEIGTFSPKQNDWIFIAPCDNAAAIPEMFIDRFEIYNIK